MAMVCLTDFEEYAKEHLSKATWDYYAAGADECCTRDDNLVAYKRYCIDMCSRWYSKHQTIGLESCDSTQVMTRVADFTTCHGLGLALTMTRLDSDLEDIDPDSTRLETS